MAGTYTQVTIDLDVDAERADLLTLLRDQRALLRITARGLTDEQARSAPTVSALSVGGLIKHVARVERDMTSQIVERDENSEVDMTALSDAYQLGEGETLDGALEDYERSATELDRVIASVDSLDDPIPQPTAPWQPEREWWSVRKLVLHMLRETAQHCGHADIVREAIDGQTTMAALFEQ
ncbi:DinB family protein [Gordonia sp. (in: high G+C Gram-positive bacteria)]|uniref:DinB family protein n=1 Tax=Gordonia sp. (in: high G+C Gram-positive bacteria) TaxID=84139 RepID=UPI003F965B09